MTIDEIKAKIKTVYVPDPCEWVNFRIRKKKGYSGPQKLDSNDALN